MKKGLFLLCVVSAASIFTGCGTSEEIKQSETTEIAESSDPVQLQMVTYRQKLTGGLKKQNCIQRKNKQQLKLVLRLMLL